MAETEQKLEPLKPIVERPPFTGFLFRLLAFVLDGVLLYFLFKGLDRTARPHLLNLNPALPWLSHIVVFLYFWICAGPLAKGQSAAKLLLGLRVVGPDGNPLGWAAAARRALVQQGVFLIFIMFNYPAYESIFPARWSYPLDLTFSMVSVVVLTFIVSLALTVALHPLKRGWHDLWANSYVTGSPVPPAFYDRMANPPDEVTGRKIANFARMSVIFWGVATLVLLLSPIRHFSNAEQRSKDRRLALIKSEFSLPGYRVVETRFPDEIKREEAITAIRRLREAQRTRGEAVATTESLMKQLESMGVVVMRTHGAFSDAELKRPEFKSGLEQLHRLMWREWQARSAGQTSSETLTAHGFVAIALEPLVMVMYNNGEFRARAQGPANPAQGSLTFEDVLPSLPKAADQKTTASASPEALRTHETPKP